MKLNKRAYLKKLKKRSYYSGFFFKEAVCVVVRTKKKEDCLLDLYWEIDSGYYEENGYVFHWIMERVKYMNYTVKELLEKLKENKITDYKFI